MYLVLPIHGNNYIGFEFNYIETESTGSGLKRLNFIRTQTQFSKPGPKLTVNNINYT